MSNDIQRHDTWYEGEGTSYRLPVVTINMR